MKVSLPGVTGLLCKDDVRFSCSNSTKRAISSCRVIDAYSFGHDNDDVAAAVVLVVVVVLVVAAAAAVVVVVILLVIVAPTLDISVDVDGAETV